MNSPDSDAPISPRISVVMTAWEWHHLLRELEQDMRVCNRDQHNLRVFYGVIASALAGREIKIEEPAPPPPPRPMTEPVYTTEGLVLVPAWLKRLFGRSS